MPKIRIVRDKQNVPVPDNKKGTTDHPKTVKRTNIARHGGSQPRVQRRQQKRKCDEVNPQPPTFHAGIQKNTKVAMQSKTHDMRDLKTNKPNVMKIVNASCGNIDAGPTVTFAGPREAFQMDVDVLQMLDAILKKVEKIPVPQYTPETLEVNHHVPNSLQMLNEAIRMIEGTAASDNMNIQKNKKLKTVKETVKNTNSTRVGAALPDAVNMLNATSPNPAEHQSLYNFKFTSYDLHHEDVFNYMNKLDAIMYKPEPGYMAKQPEVTGAMRSKVVDWLVHIFQRTNDKLFHMTVHYIDTFLSRMPLVKSKLELLACAAGMVACKTKEVHIQSAEYWVILGGGTFTEDQLLEMERLLLSIMGFELSRPTIICYIRHLCYIGKINAKIVALANYISELVLIEGDVYLRYSPSLLASAIIALARHTLDQTDIWPEKLMAITNHTRQHLLPIFAMLRKILSDASNNPNSCVFKKYAQKRYYEVAKLN